MKRGRTRLRGVGSPRNVSLPGNNDIDSINYERIETENTLQNEKMAKDVDNTKAERGKSGVFGIK